MGAQENIYAGFINSYIAGNLEANSTELNLHSAKINDLLRDLESEVKKGGYENAEKVNGKIRTIINENQGVNTEGEYKKLGQNLSDLISQIVEENGKDIPSYSTFLIKKIIYHFLNIAKTSKLTDIERTGKEMADKYQSVWTS